MAGRIGRWLWGTDGDPLRPWRIAPVACALFVGLCLVFVAERLSGPWQADVTDLRHVLGWAEPEISNGEVWRLVTSGFLHSDTRGSFGPFGFEHLFRNLALLVLVGPRLEARLGSGAFVGFVVALQVVAFAAWSWHGTPVYFGVGASGWLAGVVGALVVGAARRREWWYVVALGVFIAGWLLDPGSGQTSEQVHVFGLIGGAAIGAFGTTPSGRLRPTVLVGLAASALVPLVWHAATVDERPAVQFGRPATVVACESGLGRPHRGSDGVLEIVNQSDHNLYLASLTDGGATPLMVLHPDERIVGGFRVGDRVRLDRADGSCVVVAEVTNQPSTLRVHDDLA